MLLFDLAVGATWFAGRFGPEEAQGQRLFLLWVMPALVYFCGLLTRPPKPRASGPAAALPSLRLPGIPLPALPPVKPSLPLPTVAKAAEPARTNAGAANAPWSKLLLWLAIAILVDLAPYAVGDRLGWLTFAFSEERSGPSYLPTALWAWPLLVLLAIRFSERTLRAQLFEGLGEGRGTVAAWATTALCGTALALPALAPGFHFGSPVVVLSGLVIALGRELGATVLYRASGLLASGLYRGTLLFLDLFWIGDALRPAFAAAGYGGGADTFHLVRAAAPLVAALLLARGLASRPRSTPSAGSSRA